MSQAERISAGSFDIAGAVRLHLVVTAQIEFASVPAILGGSTAPWLGEPAPHSEPGIRHFYCDLELRVSPESRAIFRKSAIVGLGEPQPSDGEWLVPVEWRAATLAPLFPVFAGYVRLRADRIELTGSYAPPGGTIGYVLDRALLSVAARGTGRWFLRTLASALDGSRRPDG